MSRPVSDRTTAIRKLLAQTKGQITYVQAREKLPALGFPVANPGSEEYAKEMNIFNVTKSHWNKVHGSDVSKKPRQVSSKVASAEPKKRGRPRKNPLQPKYAEQPKRGRGRPRKTEVVAAEPKKRGRPRKNPEAPVIKHRGRPRKVLAQPSFNDSLKYVTKLGGVAACRAKVAALQAQIAEIDGHVSTVVTMRDQLAKVA